MNDYYKLVDLMLKPNLVRQNIEPIFEAMGIGPSILDLLISKMKSDPSLKEKIAEVYQENYTPEEISGMLAFYASSLGGSIESKAEKVNKQVVAATEEWMTVHLTLAFDEARAAEDELKGATKH